MLPSPAKAPPTSAATTAALGLKPERHIAGFSIRKEDGTEIPLIFEACVGKAKDTVILKLDKPLPEKASLWYGYGLDPYCNLTDSQDMAVPVFGPIALDEIAGARPAVAASQPESAPIKLLIITGDHGHAWKDTTRILSDSLEAGGKIKVDVTTTPSKDLTDENLAKYDVLLLNYKDTPKGAPEIALVRGQQGGIPQGGARRQRAGGLSPRLERLHQAQLGRVREGDRRRLAVAGFSRPQARLHRQEDRRQAPDLRGLPAQFEHAIDELYQNSVMVPGSTVLATAFSDPSKPRGTGKDEPVIWVNTYGKGRVYENVLGHDTEAMADPKFQDWMRRGVIWAATGKVD